MPIPGGGGGGGGIDMSSKQYKASVCLSGEFLDPRQVVVLELPGGCWALFL